MSNSSMFISAGEMPGMRDAWAMVSGLMRSSFCLASVESAVSDA